MALFDVQGEVHRPIFVHMQIEADSLSEAKAKGHALLEEHAGPRFVEDFEELVGLSDGYLGDVEILDAEEVSE